MKSLTSLGLIILAVALFFTFTNPYYKKVKKLSAAADEYQSVLDNLSRIAETRDQLLVNYASIPKAEIDRLSKVLPDTVDTVRFAQELATISSRHGIAVTEVRVDRDTPQSGSLPSIPDLGKSYDNINLSFSFIADYQKFRSFLEDLERSLRIMDVRSVTFQVGENALNEYQISMETYGLRPYTLSASGRDSDLVDMASDLSEVTFDMSLFATAAYKALIDFSTTLGQDPTGRPNPFNVIGRD